VPDQSEAPNYKTNTHYHMSNIHFNFESLRVYQSSLAFVDKSYAVSKNFPAEEKFGLTSQLRRAALSVSLNIGEGQGCTKKENIRFLTISRRSLLECIVCITVAQRLNYISSEESNALRTDLLVMSRMLNNLIAALKSPSANKTNPVTKSSK
jgi:four helix bundle protein